MQQRRGPPDPDLYMEIHIHSLVFIEADNTAKNQNSLPRKVHSAHPTPLICYISRPY